MAAREEDIERALRYRKIAVVGLSPKPDRPSYGVTEYLIRQGYEIVGIRPAQKEILGKPCYSSLREAPGPIEVVDVFRAPEFVPQIVDEAIAAEAKALWLQEGVTHPEAEAKARQAGMIVISDRCILKEHIRHARAIR
jgi:uncharacterized protein